MLYVTTRNKSDAHTAHKTLVTDHNSDGGLYVPFQMPILSPEEILSFKDKSFGQCVADILNLFFSARMDGWDVDFCIGRYPAKLIPMSHRIIVAETWHNPDWDYARMVRNLYSRLCGNDDSHGVPSNWACIAIRIATIFGLYGQLLKKGLCDGDGTFDIAVSVGDFSTTISAHYARKMGLPVGRIIVACNENGAVWDLVHQGQLKTDMAVTATNTPLCDVAVPENLERLFYDVGGAALVQQFVSACQSGKLHKSDSDVFEALRKDLFVAVVSQKRMASVISNVYRTCAYLLDPYGALAYSALLDYRAKSGEGRTTILLTEQSPICSASTVSDAMGISIRDLKERLSMT